MLECRDGVGLCDLQLGSVSRQVFICVSPEDQADQGHLWSRKVASTSRSEVWAVFKRACGK